MYAAVLAFAGGLLAAWLGATLSHHWELRRRAVAVVARAEVIVRRDLQPPLFTDSNIERAQWVLDQKGERVRTCESELRSLAMELRRHRPQLRALADALDAAWQDNALITWYFNLPQGHPQKGGAPDGLTSGYPGKQAALAEQVEVIRERLDSRVPI